MKRILLLLLLLSGMTTFAQQPPLTGTWTFNYLIDTAGREREDLREASALFADLYFRFDTSGRFRAFLMKTKMEGDWSYAPATGTIRMQMDGTTTPHEARVLRLTDSSLLLRMDRKGGYALRRSTGISDSSEAPAPPPPPPPSVSATKAQVAKRWYFLRREVPGRSEEQIRLLSELVAGSYLEFRPDGGYKGKIGKLEVDGRWSFGEGNHTIVVSVDGEQQMWTISSFSATSLVLIKGSREVWKFSVRPPAK
ncbi:hypothetical protein [Flaviaesturariibacter aridisoli]|uniref:Lipocalin-like domain-containing protein n=1 Tax=Flaviaesturariibacter aridisoli TaxID=2545761 RepID=A0A4R4E4R7_9BACT|nr:hypothetical protein [Flaviaesturariibacter aridisoli]TCZ74596.1 hypothetical protein E0486_02945 [Flaviaesturariibacter aridisoli]